MTNQLKYRRDPLVAYVKPYPLPANVNWQRGNLASALPWGEGGYSYM